MVNLKLIKYNDIPAWPSIHRPLTREGLCKGKIVLVSKIAPLVVNHYPGNLQQMLFRVHDARGNPDNATRYRLERFNEYKKNDNFFETTTIQEWLQGFVGSVGKDEASRLLESVGQPQLAATDR